ncbi:hypothetical protein ABZ370_39355 [Streptomyces sp. NPDC005962]|uniref:hypothetical protein n=1 Tax=Streptomyces sp. NPDC005962 TaxID=3154466 RepID=UPI00340B339C
MHISKKVALMAAAAAGTMVVGGAGSASAYGGLFPSGDGARQSNSCDSRIGTLAPVSTLAPPGDLDADSDCINFTNRGAAYQSNDCDTATGLITPISGAAPTGDLDVGSDCTNIAIDNTPVVVHQDPPKKDHKEKAKHHKAKKHAKAKKHGKTTKVTVKTHKSKH